MKPSSGTRAFLRITALVVATVAALGYYGHVRAQSGVGSIVVPLRPLAPLSSVPIPAVFGLEGIVADKAAAIELGKALFWDMQAGSDDTQACASCHFNAGADSRATNDVNPGQAGGDNSFQIGVPFNGKFGTNYHYNPGTAGAGFGGYHDGDFPFRKLADVNDRFSVIADSNDVSGSAGVFSTKIQSVVVGTIGSGGSIVTGNSGDASAQGGNDGGQSNDDAGMTRSPHGVGNPNSNRGTGNKGQGSSNKGGTTGAGTQVGTSTGSLTSVEMTVSTPDPVFSYPDPSNPNAVINTRKTTGRNTPSVVNAVFNYRNFWDGRAQNECNGANPFGQRDKNSHLVVIKDDGTLSNVLVSMKNSALCSQSLGPILSPTEMSADGRDFKQVGKKLLARKPLAKQMVDPTDSVLGLLSNSPSTGINTTYAALIQKAFLPEWYSFAKHICVAQDGSTAATIDPATASCPAGSLEYSQMEYNFSLFWGVAIQMYESTLVADQTPMDKYLEQQQSYTLIGDNKANQYTIQLKPGITPYTVSVVGLNPTLDASDQDIYAFDNGQGFIGGVGVNQGSVNYATGQVTIFFSDSPVSQVPIQINYSVGATPMTESQLRGLVIFQTKGGCIVCHGGPELSNASVGTVTNTPIERMIMEDDSARVYDTGFYHIGVRPSAEDAGLAGNDGVAGLPLSNAEYLRQHVCDGGFETVIVPGRRGDGIAPAPLNCGDEVARGGFFKAPQLRNVALTAPYFHNGGQLTLEQVVEYYNRGGDFNTVAEVQNMDPDIEILGLTLQDKQDLVNFLRNGLTDPRTVKQSAPFDHPQLIVSNGHPAGDGYPVQADPQHPGQATNQFMEIPAVGTNGGKPIATFLDNLVGVKNARPN
ncbi:MAG TPA: cytochrome c peroxidase [Candidatus Angelobacter sp.]|nr:cytochrome c peroxidase [Candidatus Angelobacter sp.]